MKVCIIMHNMIIEDEGSAGDIEFDGTDADTHVLVSRDPTQELEDFIQDRKSVV